MKIDPISAHTKRSGLNTSSDAASDVPTSTGATAAGSVRGRAATNQSFSGEGLGPLRELAEVGLALLLVGVTALLGLLRLVEEEVRVVGELLDAGDAVLVGVEARLEQAEGERRLHEHLPAPLHRLLLEGLERDDRVDQPHVERLLRVVLAGEEPDLLGLLWADQARQDPRPVPPAERAAARAGLAEARVVGGDRQVAHDVQHVAAADRVARDHRDHWLRRAPDLDLEVGHVEAADAALGGLVLGQVAGVAADALVAARAE